MMPVDVYSRRLSHSPDVLMAAAASGRRALSAKNPRSVDSAADAERAAQLRVFAEAAETPFTKDLKRGSICAFVAGGAEDVDEWAVTVGSILQFAPGVRVAVAVEEDALGLYRR